MQNNFHLALLAVTFLPLTKLNGKTKHFNIKFYYLIKMQQSGEVNLIYCRFKDQLVDMFTKSLPINKLELKELEFAVPKARRSVEDILL